METRTHKLDVFTICPCIEKGCSPCVASAPPRLLCSAPRGWPPCIIVYIILCNIHGESALVPSSQIAFMDCSFLPVARAGLVSWTCCLHHGKFFALHFRYLNLKQLSVKISTCCVPALLSNAFLFLWEGHFIIALAMVFWQTEHGLLVKHVVFSRREGAAQGTTWAQMVCWSLFPELFYFN